MSLVQIIIVISIVVQAIAAFLAIGLNFVYGRRWAWTILSIAISLITVRRCLTLYLITWSSDVPFDVDEPLPLLLSSSVALTVSTLFLLGVAFVFPIFRDIQRAQLILAEDNQRLGQIVTENEQEFHVARKIQLQLTPTAAPDVPGFSIAGTSTPARHASGDFFDYLTLADGSPCIVVGDASGHGIGAAILISETRAFLRAIAERCNDPAEILTRLNRLVSQDTTNGQFVTIFLAKTQLESRTIVCAGAGQPGFIRSAGEIQKIEDDNLPLGVDEEFQFTSSHTLHLAKGDLLLLCSDGVWEASNGTVMFEIVRVEETIQRYGEKSAAELVSSLEDSVMEFTGRTIPSDDITIVAVKVK